MVKYLTKRKTPGIRPSKTYRPAMIDIVARRPVISRFAAEWPQSLDSHHMEAYLGLAQEITSDKFFREAFNQKNYPDSKFRPSTRDVRQLWQSLMRDSVEDDRIERSHQYQYIPAGCLYCIDGEVNDLVWRDKWTVEAIGRCSCSGGDAECHPGIRAVAKRWDMHCMQVMFKIVLLPLFVAGFASDKGGFEEGVKVFLDGLLDDPKLAPFKAPL